MNVAVLEKNTYDSYREAIYLFEDNIKAREWIRKAWKHEYDEINLKSKHEEKIEVVDCWCYDMYAQICYINIDDDEPQIFKKHWTLIAFNEPSKHELAGVKKNHMMS